MRDKARKLIDVTENIQVDFVERAGTANHGSDSEVQQFGVAHRVNRERIVYPENSSSDWNEWRTMRNEEYNSYLIETKM